MLPFHPVANLFPMMDEKDFEELKADIAAHGQREPIWTYQAQIIDGRNRARACEALGIEPKLREWDGQGSLAAFIASLNLCRRHLNNSQRAAIAAELLFLLEAEAKERQRQAGQRHGRGRKVPQKVAGAKGEAREQAARIAGTNRQYVSLAKTIRDAAPDLFAKVKEGKLNLHQARVEMTRQQKREEFAAFAKEHPVGVGGFILFEERPSWSCKNLKPLSVEVRARPEFVARQAEVAGLEKEASRRRREAEKKGRLVREAEEEALRARHQLDRDVRARIAQEHGPLVGFCYTDYRLDAALQEQLDAIDDPEEQRQELLLVLGRCLACETRLPHDSTDAYCSWCLEHRGRSHCQGCGAPLDPEEYYEECRTCLGAEEYARRQRLLKDLEEWIANGGTVDTWFVGQAGAAAEKKEK
jgi:hypothetical protein